MSSQKIKGTKKLNVFSVEDLLRQKSNRKFLGWMPYLTAYYIGEKRYDSLQVKDDIIEEKADFEQQREAILSDTASMADFREDRKEKREKVKERTKKRYDRIMRRYEKRLNKKGLDSLEEQELLKTQEAEISTLRARFDKQMEKISSRPRKLIRLKRKHDRRIGKLETKLEKGNWMMRAVGEPPVYYDSTATTASARQIELYLRKKGFFNGSLSVSVDTLSSKRRIRTRYRIEENKRSRIRNITVKAENDTINRLLLENKKRILIEHKDYYDEEKLSDERERIFNLLRNNGYYDFSRQHIVFLVDTTIGKNQADIDIVVKNPPKNKPHKIYTVDKVYFNTNISSDAANRDTVIYAGIHFITDNKRLSKKILAQKTPLRPNKKYSLKETQQTQTGLANLDYFKFINITYQDVPAPSDSAEEKHLIAHISGSPFERYQISDEWGINVTTQAQGIPGPFFNLAFKARNFLGGFKRFQFNIRGSMESVSASDEQQRLSNQELTGTGSIFVPRFLFPTGIFPKRWRDGIERTNPETIFSGGVGLVSRMEYDRFTFNSNMTYSFKPKVTSRFNFTPIDLNIVNTSRISERFQGYLDELAANGNNLRESFNQSFISSISASYITNNNQLGVNTKSRFVIINVESGGAGARLLDRMSNDNGQIFSTSYFQFAKGNVDYRQYFPVTRNSTLAIRANAGLAYPYSTTSSDAILPYEKHFFIGGSNSIRAWRPRRLGPGSFTPPQRADGSFDYSFEQPGELILESSIEYRFNLISFLDMAFFADVGNIWTFDEDPSRPGANIDENFITEIAVGTGVGFRLDFTFLILRVDIGIKVWDPARPTNDRFVLDKFTLGRIHGDREGPTFNLGIGYPF